MSKEIIVIGGGPAGIEAARAARKQGAQVTIVSNAPIGGRAGWHSLLPSKVWLSVADAAGVLHETTGLGLATETAPEPEQILARLRQVKEAWNAQQKAELVQMGVQIVAGTAVFTAPDRIAVQDKEGNVLDELSADAFVITTGSVPIFPPSMKPNGRRIIAPRFASALDPLPSSIAVVGGGATGCEFAYLFNRLGVDVTWIVDELGVLPDFDPAAGEFLADLLIRRGVTLVAGYRAEQITETDDGVVVTTVDGRSHDAAMAFLAIGRRPDVRALNLEAAGLAVEGETVTVDEYGRAANPHIYLAGDVTGAPMIANRAMAQAWIAGQHAAGADVPPFRPQAVVAAIYSAPQVAQIGRLDGDDVQTVRVPFRAGLKGHLLPEDGFVKLAVDTATDQVRGAVAVGDHAADVLAPLAVAIQAGMTATELATLYGAHPTISELAFIAARAV